MVLRMSGPWPHPKTGVFWFRKGVPAKFRETLGKREIKRSLGTKNATLARTRFLEVAAEVDAQWRAIDQGPISLSHKELLALAGDFYRNKIVTHEDEPGSAFERERELKWKRERATMREVGLPTRPLSGPRPPLSPSERSDYSRSCMGQMSPADRAMVRLIAEPKRFR